MGETRGEKERGEREEKEIGERGKSSRREIATTIYFSCTIDWCSMDLTRSDFTFT